MRMKIGNAFLELLRDNSYEEITVQDIAKKAGIHRSSFYVYYFSKESLYALLVENILYDLEKAISPKKTVEFKEIVYLYKKNEHVMIEATLFLQHILIHRHAYEVLLKDFKFQQQFAEVISKEILKGEILPKAMTNHLAYGAIGLVCEWLDNPTLYTIEELSMYLTQMNVFALIKYKEKPQLLRVVQNTNSL